jgi:hypothetical protein
MASHPSIIRLHNCFPNPLKELGNDELLMEYWATLLDAGFAYLHVHKVQAPWTHSALQAWHTALRRY